VALVVESDIETLRTFKANVGRLYARRASGRRIAEEIAVIRTALKRRGYRIRKQAKQAAWAVYVTDDKFYLLTYQPAAISTWVLHPQDNDASGDTLSTIIQRALTQKPAKTTRKKS
jgi:hypothetical protein